jgi:uncharacterized repeat protein (TIGR01451 family)
MKKRLGLMLVIAIGLLGSLWVFTQAYAAHADAFTYFIPYPADRLDEQFDIAHNVGGPNNPDFFTTGIGGGPVPISITISISVLRDDTVVYYDHWEDGLEDNITFPTQASTEVWGDGDPSNGTPPGVGGDTLSSGDVIILRSTVPLPRDQANFFFDGGDKFVSVGGQIAVTLAVWPEILPTGEPGILFAGAWELYPTSRWGTRYIIPIGQDLAGLRGGFSTVGINVQAIDDGTLVDLDLDANGVFEIQDYPLDEGQSFTQVEGVNSGAEVQSDQPVQVHIFTGDRNQFNNALFEARAYTMIPRDQWDDEYLAPRSTEGDFWLYNPSGGAIDIDAMRVGGTDVINVPGGTTAQYNPGLTTGVHFRSVGNEFYGVAALDPSYIRDWGYALLPINNLTTQALVGWAPGNNDSPPSGNESRVYVTATAVTTVVVEYADGFVDSVPIITPLAEVEIFSAAHPDLTGARLRTENGVPFIAVWGQDETAPAQLPSIDVGTNIAPLRSPVLQKTFTLLEEGYNCGTLSRGHTLHFELLVYNDAVSELVDAVISDTLSTGVSYVPGSTTLDGVPIPDDTSGSPFPLDGGYAIGSVPGLDTRTITFDAVIEDAGLFVNEGEFVSPANADSASVEMLLPFREAGYTVTKSLIDPPSGTADPGDTITFEVMITNTGTVTIAQLPLRDEYDTEYLTFNDASVTPDSEVPGTIDWDNLAPAPGGLLTDTAVSLTLSFTVVNPLPAGGTDTINVVLSEGVQGGNGIRQAIVCDEASVEFAAPTPTPTPEPPDDHEPSPTPTPTSPPPPPPPSEVPPPTPAVLFLPETGIDSSGAAPVWPLVVFPGLGLLMGWAVYRRLNR